MVKPRGEQMEAQTADELDAGQGQGFEAVEREILNER